MTRDVPFSCVPVGTRNHFAMDLVLDRSHKARTVANAVTDTVGHLETQINLTLPDDSAVSDLEVLLASNNPTGSSDQARLVQHVVGLMARRARSVSPLVPK